VKASSSHTTSLFTDCYSVLWFLGLVRVGTQDMGFSWELVRNRLRLHPITTEIPAAGPRVPGPRLLHQKSNCWTQFSKPIWSIFCFKKIICSRLKKTKEAWQANITQDSLLFILYLGKNWPRIQARIQVFEVKGEGLSKWKNSNKILNSPNLITALWSN
jgi:hypothetical protein